jgi:hypothetical protein
MIDDQPPAGLHLAVQVRDGLFRVDRVLDDAEAHDDVELAGRERHPVDVALDDPVTVRLWKVGLVGFDGGAQVG